MIKSLTIVAIAASSFAGTALAAGSHRHAPADAAAYYSDYDQRPVAPAAAPAPAPREDFGSFGAGSVARNLGY